jgi:hypothetical protein
MVQDNDMIFIDAVANNAVRLVVRVNGAVVHDVSRQGNGSISASLTHKAQGGAGVYDVEFEAFNSAGVRSDITRTVELTINRHKLYRYQSSTLWIRLLPIECSLVPVTDRDEWRSSIFRGMSAWSSSFTNISVLPNQSAQNPNTVRVIPLPFEQWGVISYRPTMPDFQITLNSFRIRAQNEVQSVMAHELGHALGLRDNPFGSVPLYDPRRNGSIMNQERNRNQLTGPTAFEVDSVNMLY